MNLPFSIRAAAAASLSCFFGCGAAQATDRGPESYVGASLGAAGITPDGLKSINHRDNEGRASGGAFVGLRLATLPVSGGWPLYLELGYQDIARHTLRYKVQNATSDLTAEGYAVSLATRLAVPLTERFGLYVRLGASRARVDGSTPTGQASIEVKGSGTGVVSGFGLEYQFESGPTLRGEVTRYAKVSPNAGAAAFTLGMAFRF